MTTRLNPYLHFKDNARQAMEFYHSVFGGKVDISTFSEYQPTNDPIQDNKVMHAQLAADNGIVFMAADTPPGMEINPGASIGMSLSGDDEAELRGYFDRLSAGGQVSVPMEKAPWGDTFGMLTDKFGVEWMVNVAGPRA